MNFRIIADIEIKIFYYLSNLLSLWFVVIANKEIQKQQ